MHQKYWIVNTLFLIFSHLLLIHSQDVICSLTGQLSQDPFPSLSKCYKYNNDACCTSVHDDYINDSINQLLTESCLRRYSDFENLMCLGCNPLESLYVDTKEKKNILRICKGFAMKLWNVTSEEGLERPTTVFDNCGFKISDTLKILFDNDTDGKYTYRKNYIIPSETFPSFEQFVKMITIPFYEDFEIKLVNDSDSEMSTCFGTGRHLTVWSGLLILVSSML